MPSATYTVITLGVLMSQEQQGYQQLVWEADLGNGRKKLQEEA